MSAQHRTESADVFLRCAELLDAALACSGRGWPVLGVWWPHGGRCACPAGAACKSPAKHPHPSFPHGLKDATRDADVIRSKWKSAPTMNVAIATGAEAGLWVLEVDLKGSGALVDLVTRNGPIGPTLAATSGSGGSHYLLRWPGFHVPSRANAIAPGIDQRGAGGYLLVAPSRNMAGSYSWRTDNDGEILDAPAWLLELATRGAATDAAAPVARPVPGRWGTDLDRRVARALAYIDRCQPAIAGSGGHAATFRVALHLVRGFELPAPVALECLAHFNTRCEPPWSRAELAHKIADAERANASRGYLLQGAA